MRQSIYDTVANSIKQISTANNYQTDIGKNVFLWRDKPLNTDEYPACILQDTDVIYDEDSGHKLNIEAIVVVKDIVNDSVATETRKAMQDVSKAAKVAITGLGIFGKIRKTEMIIDDRAERVIAGRLIIEIIYSDDEWSI